MALGCEGAIVRMRVDGSMWRFWDKQTVAIRGTTNPKLAMDIQFSISLSRLHEFSQLHIDRKTDFLVGERFRRLEAEDQLRFRMALVDATASLGHFTAAVLQVDGRPLQSYLIELFDRFAALEEVSKAVGAPTAPGAFETYRRLCLSDGLAEALGSAG